MTSTGQLNNKVSFQRRPLVSDGYGNAEGDFEEVFIRWVEIRPSLGIETVNAARLSGQQPVDIIVRMDSDTRQISAAWRAVGVNDGIVYAITSPAIDLKQDNMFLTIKAVVGAAP